MIPNQTVTSVAEEIHTTNGTFEIQAPKKNNLAVDLKIGDYVLVQFSKITKYNSNFRQFLGVVQSEVDKNCELKVMFLKNNNTDNTLFCLIEKDIAYININQIVAVIEQPNIVLKRGRIYYKFNNPIPIGLF